MDQGIPDLLKIYAGSPLAIVNEIIVSGKFAPAPEKLIGKKEKPLRELTTFEKAVYTVCRQIEDSYATFIESAWENPSETDSMRLRGYQELYDFYRKLLARSIVTQLASASISCNRPAIRAEYMVVDATPPKSFLKDIFERITCFINTKADESPALDHNCAECPIYDNCPLPFKKPRE